jgi:predicted alpha/beta-hydrolase family hydrolase
VIVHPFAAGLVAAALGAAVMATSAEAAFLESPVGEVFTVPSRTDVTVRYFGWMPEGPPRATVVLFIGGHGMLNISGARPGPTWSNSGNFLTRSREWFRRRGFYVAAIDVPSDRARGYGAFRVTPEHVADVAAVVADLRRRVPEAPVWLIGTSAGTVSAANAAAALPAGTIAGAVLTATVTRGGEPSNEMGGKSVLNTDLARIRVPVLLAHHRADACVASPFTTLDRARSQLARVEVLTFDGGDPPSSGPCEPRSPHGFLGIEEQVVNAIADWILAAKS